MTGVRARLLALVMLAGVPAFAVALFNSIEARQLALETARQTLHADVREAREDLTQGIRSAGYLLAAFSRIPEVVQGMPEGCDLLAGMAGLEGRYASFVITDATGVGICGSAPEYRGTSFASRDYVRTAIASRALAIGSLVTGRAIRKAILPMAYPVLDAAGKVRALLLAGIDIPWYGERFAGELHSPDATLSVWDARGRLLYRYPEKEESEAASHDAPVAAAITGGTGARVVESVGIDGAERLYGLGELKDYPQLGLTLALGLTKQGLFASADAQFVRTITFLLVAAAIAFVGSLWVAERLMAKPVAALTDASRRLALGEASVRIPEPFSGGELGMLAAQFNRTAAAVQAHREHLEDLVQQRTAALQASNKELEAFAYSVSHDLRAPLRHIAGYVELLSTALPDLEERPRRYLQVISEASHEMDRLIEDLLALSRITRTDVQPAEFDANALVTEAMQTAAETGKSDRIDWRIERLPALVGDPRLVRLVFANLIENAVKYSGTRERPVIEIGCAGMEGDHAVIFVRDNGVGFDMRYADKLFQVFQRLHSAAEFKGTGIGLATAQRIVQRHGGRIWAQAKPDEGAAFFFTMRTARRAA